MADFALIIVGVLLAFIVILILLTRMISVIQPGQIGIVLVYGVYRRALLPGFNMVDPMAVVRKITPGSGPNKALGMLGTAETDLAPDRPPGDVKIGDTRLTARSTRPIPAGSAVRVIEDSTAGIVLVAPERPRLGAATGPAKPSTPLP